MHRAVKNKDGSVVLNSRSVFVSDFSAAALSVSEASVVFRCIMMLHAVSTTV